LYEKFACKMLMKLIVSQPFGLQVPVEDRFLHYCPGHNILLSFCPSNVLLIIDYKIDQDSVRFTWIAFPIIWLTEFNNWYLINAEF